MSVRTSRRWAPAEALRLLVVLVGSLGALGPFLEKGMPGGTHDGGDHLYRLLDFDQVFRQGIFLPRLAPDQALGYGYASFTYYSPLTLYLGEAFRLSGLGTIASLKGCFILAVLTGGFGMYLLARDLFGWRSGLVAGLAYVYLPYLLVDIYTRGDLAETLALGILPFVFWSLRRAATPPDGPKDSPRLPIPWGRVAALGISLAALVMVHNLTALLATPALLVFLLVTLGGRPGALARALPGLLLSAALALALSAVYWLPVLTTLGDLNTTALTDGYFDYHRWFTPVSELIQFPWSYDYRFALELGARFNLGRAEAALLVIAALWAIVVRPRQRGVLVFAAVGIVVLLWLQQAGATFVWDHVPGARFVQFPYRLTVDIDPLAALLLGGFLAEGTRPRIKAIGTGIGIAALATLVVTSTLNLPFGHLSLQEAEVNLPSMWQLEIDRGLISGSTRGDYLPNWVQGEFFQMFRQREAAPQKGASSAELTAVAFGPLSLTATSNASAPTTLTIDQLYTRNWTARIDGKSVPIGPSGPLGELTLPVPAGQHRLTISAGETSAGTIGVGLAALGILGVLVIVVGFRRPGWQRRLLALVALAVAGGIVVGSQIQPARQLAAGGIDYAGGVRLVGSALDPAPSAPPGVVQVSLLWEATRAPLPDCTVHLRLIDDTGRVVARRDKPPLFGIRPCSSWSANEIVHDTEQIRLPPGAAPGRYRLVLGISLANPAWSAPSSANIALVSWHDPGQPVAEGTGVLLADVTASRPPPSATLADARPVGAVLGNTFLLESERVKIAASASESGTPPPVAGPVARLVDLFHPVPEPVFVDSPADPRFVARLSPGGQLAVDLLWRSLGDAAPNYAVFTHLLNAHDKLVAQDDDWPDHANLPTSVWFPGDTLVDHYYIAVPPSLPPGVYTLATGMYQRGKPGQLPATGKHAAGDQVVLGTVKVIGADHTYGPAVSPPPRSADFGSQIALVGAGATTESARAGSTATVNLVWLAMTRPNADYTAFVHLLDDNGKVVAQHDSPPLAGTYPTHFWDPGDRVGDSIGVPLPANLPAGTYRIEVGLYQPTTGVRLTTSTGSSIIIGTIRVQ